MHPDLDKLLAASLGDPACAFSVGGFGALAEFQDSELCRGSGALALSPRGAIRIAPPADVTLLAYESLAANAHGWQCGVGVLGAAAGAAMGQRTALCELGADHDAVQAAHREAMLFDLGAGLPHVDFCVRTADPDLIRLLRAHAGQSVIAEHHPVIEAIIDASPHRVVVSRAARIEVYQPIDRRHTPPGPHTHFLPRLLQRRRTHAAHLPIPRGRLPLLTLHPEHPLLDHAGQRRPFSARAHAQCESLLARFGAPGYVREKRRFVAAVSAGAAPQDYVPAGTRLGRLAQRVALRQLAHTLPDPAAREPWLAHFKT